MPSWRSRLSRWRVPKTIVKPASASATYSVPSCHHAAGSAAATPGGAGQHAVAGVDRLQLQRDVGHDADHRDQRHQPGQQRALAVTAGDEVGDRGDAVGARDADHLAQHQPGQQHRQRRSEVDRQEPDAARGRAADAAEIGPGGAIDRDRQRVDPGVGDHRALLHGAPVGPPGDDEQQQQVRERRAEHQRRRDHALRLRRSISQASTAISGAQTMNSAAGKSGMPATSCSRSHSASSGKLNKRQRQREQRDQALLAAVRRPWRHLRRARASGRSRGRGDRVRNRRRTCTRSCCRRSRSRPRTACPAAARRRWRRRVAMPARPLIAIVNGAQRSASGGGSPCLSATSEKSRRTRIRQARRSQKKAIGNSARNRIQVSATLTSKTIVIGSGRRRPATWKRALPAAPAGPFILAAAAPLRQPPANPGSSVRRREPPPSRAECAPPRPSPGCAPAAPWSPCRPRRRPRS